MSNSVLNFEDIVSFSKSNFNKDFVTKKQLGLGISSDFSFVDFSNFISYTPSISVSCDSADDLFVFGEFSSVASSLPLNIVGDINHFAVTKFSTNLADTNNSTNPTASKYKDLIVNSNIDFFHFSNTKFYVLYVKSSENKFNVTVNISNPDFSSSHIIVVSDKGTKADIHFSIESESKDSNTISTNFMSIICNDNSEINLFESKLLSSADNIYVKRFIFSKDNAICNYNCLDLGGNCVVGDFVSTLVGVDSNANVNNFYFANDAKFFDYNLVSSHFGRGSQGVLFSKGVSKSAKVFTRGLVRINEPAFDSNGYEKAETLLLDDDASVISIPDLEIHNHQVKCSHGSTVTSLDEEKLFYFLSRGISPDTAKTALVKGFFDSGFSRFNNSKFQDLFNGFVNEFVENIK